jgi:hypothetical protein
VLENAIADHARISTVNLLTFDYYIGTEQDMVADTETAAAGSYAELQSLYPSDFSHIGRAAPVRVFIRRGDRRGGRAPPAREVPAPPACP